MVFRILARRPGLAGAGEPAAGPPRRVAAGGGPVSQGKRVSPTRCCRTTLTAQAWRALFSTEG